MTDIIAQTQEDALRRRLSLAVARRAWHAMDPQTAAASEAKKVFTEAAALLKEAALNIRGAEIQIDHDADLLTLSLGDRPRYKVTIEREADVLRVYGGDTVIARWDDEQATFKPVEDGCTFAVEAVIKVALAEIMTKRG